MRRTQLAAAILLPAALAAGDHAHAQSLGLMHLPSTVPQYFGYGYGPGHQVPVVKARRASSARVPRYVRMPGYAAPAPYQVASCGGACGAWGAGAAVPANVGQNDAGVDGPIMTPNQYSVPAPAGQGVQRQPSAPTLRGPLPPSKLPAPDDREARRPFFPM